MMYKVCRGPSLGDIETTVNIAISNGWTPLGGVSNNNSGTFYQAITKEVAKRRGRPPVKSKVDT